MTGDRVRLAGPNGDRLVLASGSVTRLGMLRAAGLDPQVVPPAVDEDMVRDALVAEDANPLHIAITLAELKATKVSANRPGDLVIGADQILVHDGAILAKPTTMAEAKAQLERLRGSKHELISAAAVALNGSAIWRQAEPAVLTVRSFSDGFLTQYLAAVGETVLDSVGAYRIEGPGVQLFAAVRGDHNVILGMPLLPLLNFLREHGAVAA